MTAQVSFKLIALLALTALVSGARIKQTQKRAKQQTQKCNFEINGLDQCKGFVLAKCETECAKHCSQISEHECKFSKPLTELCAEDCKTVLKKPTRTAASTSVDCAAVGVDECQDTKVRRKCFAECNAADANANAGNFISNKPVESVSVNCTTVGVAECEDTKVRRKCFVECNEADASAKAATYISNTPVESISVDCAAVGVDECQDTKVRRKCFVECNEADASAKAATYISNTPVESTSIDCSTLITVENAIETCSDVKVKTHCWDECTTKVAEAEKDKYISASDPTPSAKDNCEELNAEKCQDPEVRKACWETCSDLEA